MSVAITHSGVAASPEGWHSTLVICPFKIRISAKIIISYCNIRYFVVILYLVKLLDMGYATKVQCIKRKASEQWYVNFPAAMAQALEFQQGEMVEWLIDDHQNLALKRSDEAVAALKKKLPARKKS